MGCEIPPHHVVSASSVQFEPPAAIAEALSDDAGPAAASTMMSDRTAKEVSFVDGAGRREHRHRSGNLSVVSEESALKPLSQGSLRCSKWLHGSEWDEHQLFVFIVIANTIASTRCACTPKRMASLSRLDCLLLVPLWYHNL